MGSDATASLMGDNTSLTCTCVATIQTGSCHIISQFSRSHFTWSLPWTNYWQFTVGAE